MSESFYQVVCAVLIGVYAAARAPFQWQYRSIEKRIRLHPIREGILISLVTAGWWGTSAVWLLTDWLDPGRIWLPDVFRLAGAAAMFGGIVFFFVVHRHLGQHWSPALEVNRSHSLVETGPYRRIRHPMYSAIWISIIGQGILCANWIVFVGAAATFALLCFIRIPDEEKMLLAELGAPYADYMKRTGRILPKLF